MLLNIKYVVSRSQREVFVGVNLRKVLCRRRIPTAEIQHTIAGMYVCDRLKLL